MKKLLILFVLIVNNIFAQGIPYNEELRINDNFGYNQIAITLTSHKLFICWQNVNGQIEGKIIDEFGNTVKSEFLISSNREFYGNKLSASIITNSKFIVCYEGFGGKLYNYNIFAQIIDFQGNLIGEEFIVNSTIKNDQHNPVISSLSNGSFVISWEGIGVDESWQDIFAQIFDSTGVKIENEFLVNTTTLYSQTSPTLCELFDVGFVISWESLDIYFQIFDYSGSKVGVETKANTNNEIFCSYPSVAELSDGKFIISWSSLEQDGDYFGIYAQKFSKIGIKIDGEFRVNTITKGSQFKSFTQKLSNNKFIIAWATEMNNLNDEIFAQIFNNNLERIGTEFRINSVVQNDQWDPQVTNISDSLFFICWASENIDNNSLYEVHGKYYLQEPINHILKNFNLVKPSIDETIYASNILFKWNKSSVIHINFPWELTYDLYIDKDEDFSNPIIISGIEDTTYQIDSLTPGKTYFWKILEKNISGDSLWSSNVNGYYIDPTAVTEVGKVSQTIPSEFKVEQNYPNPFNPTTTISYSIPNVETLHSTSVRLAVYDILGRLVKVLVNETQKPGNYSVVFDGSNLSSGIYYYTVTAGEFSITKKMILLR